MVTVVAFAIWVYRANVNARQLGAQEMEFTPGWAVGWYFVPIFSFWKPYQAVKEIWRASRNPGAWQSEAVPSLLPWWWTFWVASCIAGNLAFRFSLSAHSTADLMVSTQVNMLASATSIPSAILAAVLVGQICDMQLARAPAASAQNAGALPTRGEA